MDGADPYFTEKEKIDCKIEQFPAVVSQLESYLKFCFYSG